MDMKKYEPVKVGDVIKSVAEMSGVKPSDLSRYAHMEWNKGEALDDLDKMLATARRF